MALRTVAQGPFAAVVMTTTLHESFVALARAGKREPMRRLQRQMELYANDGPTYLPESKFKKNEGRHPLGDGFARDVMIQAFADKDAGIRVYGCLEDLDGKKCFVCTVMDDNKKKRKADPAKLKRAATVAGMELRAKGVTK